MEWTESSCIWYQKFYRRHMRPLRALVLYPVEVFIGGRLIDGWRTFLAPALAGFDFLPLQPVREPFAILQ
jgi:hypothetical protein